MALDINLLRKPADGGEYRSDIRLCVTADDEITTEDDPRAVRLLVGVNGTIPLKLAEHYGLIGEPAKPKHAAMTVLGAPVTVVPVETKKRVLSDLKLDELLALAGANNIEIPADSKKADVFKLLKDAKVAVPQETTGDGSGESLPDFGAMSREELDAFAEEHEIDVPDGTDDDALRQLLIEAEKTSEA